MGTGFDEIYESVTGQVLPEYTVPGVRNVFAEGAECDFLYSQVQEACYRISERLDEAENQDLQQILNCMDAICKQVAEEIYRFAKTDC